VTERPTGTVTFLFTDVERSTELLRRLRDEYGNALAAHQRLVRQAVERHGGVEVDTQGDAFFFAFQRASDAVRAAIEAQRTLAEHEWPDGAAVRVRMGLHTGAARLEDGRYHGLPVHRAARISSAAHGGQILLSESTRALLADEEELVDVGFRNLGPLALKDFAQPIRVYRVTAPDLPEVGRRPSARPRSRRRLFVVAGAVASLAAAAAVALIVILGGGHAPARVPLNSVAVLASGSGKLSWSAPVGRAPASIALDETAAWVANRGSSTITRIDAATRATSTIGGFQSGLEHVVVGGGRIWTTERTAGLASVNDATLTASAPTALLTRDGAPYSAEAIAYGFDALWIVGALPGALVLLRVDPTTEGITASKRVGVRSQHAIALGRNGVWVSNLLENNVIEFDAKTLRIVRRVQIGGPAAIAFGDGSLWVCGGIDKGVWRLRERDRYRSRHLIPVGGDPVAIAYGQGAAWAALRDGTVVRIDALTNAVQRTKVATVLNSIAVGIGGVWAAVGPVSFL
jgi:class 3 adenylate cyclase